MSLARRDGRGRASGSLAVGVAVVGAAMSLAADRADACGGCVAPVDTPFAVDGHRMAIKVGNGETILWDQFSWSGDPDDFAWILPLPSVGTVELADAGFFDALEETTRPRVTGPTPPPPVFCDEFDSFGPSGNVTDAAASTDSGVTVYYSGTVGPYETVTIGATDPNELYTWLTDHGYSIPPAALPTIDWYVNLGSVFVALRLQPEFGIDKMQPVRVRYPMEAISFPLKMVAVGAAEALDLTLWIVADERYHALNYPDTVIDDANLVWDSAIGRSNYTELYDAAVASNDGRTWVTEYADATSEWAIAFPYDYETGTERGREDWMTAITGIANPWLTRLRTTMSPAALDEDLFLEPSWTPYNPVSNQHFTSVDLNPPPAPPPCPKNGPFGGGGGNRGGWLVGGGSCAVTAVGHAAGRAGTASLVLVAIAGGLLLARRGRRR